MADLKNGGAMREHDNKGASVDPGTSAPPVMLRDGREVICINEACARVGVSRRTIYYWIGAGKVQHVRTAGGPIRIYVDSLWREGQISGHV